MYSWGYNGYGNCGDGNTEVIFTPTLIKRFVGIEVLEIKCGVHHSYVKTIDGRHWFCGSNGDNECLGRRDDVNPMCIDDEVMQKLDGKEIKSVYLGNRCTYIVC